MFKMRGELRVFPKTIMDELKRRSAKKKKRKKKKNKKEKQTKKNKKKKTQGEQSGVGHFWKLSNQSHLLSLREGQ